MRADAFRVLLLAQFLQPVFGACFPQSIQSSFDLPLFQRVLDDLVFLFDLTGFDIAFFQIVQSLIKNLDCEVNVFTFDIDCRNDPNRTLIISVGQVNSPAFAGQHKRIEHFRIGPAA